MLANPISIYRSTICLYWAIRALDIRCDDFGAVPHFLIVLSALVNSDMRIYLKSGPGLQIRRGFASTSLPCHNP